MQYSRASTSHSVAEYRRARESTGRYHVLTAAPLVRRIRLSQFTPHRLHTPTVNLISSVIFGNLSPGRKVPKSPSHHTPYPPTHSHMHTHTYILTHMHKHTLFLAVMTLSVIGARQELHFIPKSLEREKNKKF